MKKKKKPAPRQRQTLAKKIRNAFRESGFDAASTLANEGSPPLTDIQREVDQYTYWSSFAHWQKHGSKSEAWGEILKSCSSRLCDQLLAAIDHRDPEPFRQIATLLERERESLPLDTAKHGDVLRSHLLTLGAVLKRGGTTITLSKLQDLLRYKNDPAALRRIAKECGFPLAPERRGRRPIIRARKASAKA